VPPSEPTRLEGDAHESLGSIRSGLDLPSDVLGQKTNQGDSTMKTILTAVALLTFAACAPGGEIVSQNEQAITSDAGHLADGAACQACALRTRPYVGCVEPGSCGTYGCLCVSCQDLGCQ
jgi:hypothetical protein